LSAKARLARVWTVLGATAAVAVAVDVAVFRADERPLIDRRTCLAEPSVHTLALDRSRRGDALYRFVYTTLLGLGEHARRPGFPHVDVAPACTVGWKDPVAAIKIGPTIFVVTFDGARIVSVKAAAHDA
jgi:hypothetical protein